MEPKLWRPLLEGDLAEQARAAIRDIAEALAASPGEWPSRMGMERGGSLAGGKAGFALFHGYCSLAGGAGAEAQAELAGERLDEAIETLADVPMGPGLYSGFTGIAWTAEHLGRVLAAGEPDEDEDEDVNEEIDDALLSALGQSPWQNEYDLISGLVGLGVYALERVSRPSAVRCLEAVVDRLDETAERQEGGITWFTPPEWLPLDTRELTPLGYYNLGLAHGVPGVIALLAEACRLGIRQDRAQPLVEGAVRWLLAQSRTGAGGPSCFATFVGEGFEPRSSRLAWCYGDPGIAAALLLAARSMGREDWEQEALALAARAAQASPEDSGVRDPGLCHGAFGLAHLYNRIYQAGGGELFADSARQWYRLGLEMRSPDRGVAGFSSLQPGKDHQLEWADDPGLLTGAAGVGLALLAGVSAVEPDWDRVLMVSVPPRHS